MEYITKNLKTSGLRYLGILVVLAGIASMPGVNAQSIYTAEHFFPSCNGTNAIVRENSVGLPVVQYQNAQGVNFVYGDPSIGNVRNFVIPVLYYPNQSLSFYVVNDMEVVDNVCYFCGVRVHAYTSGTPNSDSTGFVGRFTLPVTGVGAVTGYELQTLQNVKSLKRMTVCKEENDQTVMIAMIGRSDSTSPADCLAMVKNTAPGGGWLYDLRICNDTLERFTDIDQNNKLLLIVSRREATGEENSVHFREAPIDNIMYSHDCTHLFTRYKFNTASSGLYSVNYSMKHRLDADIQMIAVDDDSPVYVAYECLAKDGFHNYATALCRINTAMSPFEMDNFQIIEEDFQEPGTFVDMKRVFDTLPATNVIALLHLTNNDSYRTVVEYPFESVSNYGTPANTYMQYSQERGFSSLSIYNGNKIRMGGVATQTSNDIVHLDQDRTHVYSDKYNCIPHKTVPVTIKGNAITPVDFYVFLRKHFLYPIDFSWGEMHNVQNEVVGVECNCMMFKQ